VFKRIWKLMSGRYSSGFNGANIKTSKTLRVLILGYGDIGQRLVGAFQGSQQQWGALIRKPAEALGNAARPAILFQGDLDQRASLERALAWAQAVIYLAPPPNHGAVDTRLAHCLQVLARPRPRPAAQGMPLPPRFVYVSTTGIYGNFDGVEVHETSRLRTRSERGHRRVQAESQIRQASALGQIRGSILRAPGIYALDRLPLARLRERVPALQPKDDVYTNHIHATDLARLCWWALYKGLNNRSYNAVDLSDMLLGDYLDAVADAFQLPRPERLSRQDLSAQVSSVRLSFMSESRRIRPHRLAHEWGYRWAYPRVTDTLKGLA
jgi:nucleoside-diphosphate-sugar epimerase